MVLAGVAHADPTEARVKELETQVARLEQRIRKLEEANAKYAEALDFLQKVYAQQKQQQLDQANDGPPRDAISAVDIADDLQNNQVLGPAGAPVTIVWAFDLADPYSARSVPVIDQLVASYKGKVRVVLKHMVVHPQVATTAHEIACAAGKQRKFGQLWHAHWDKTWDAYVQSRDVAEYDRDRLLAVAKGAGLDIRRLQIDLPACDALVKADIAELTKFKVNATPTFFINGVVIQGAMPKEEFVRVIDEQLAIAERSGIPAAQYYEKAVRGKGTRPAP